VNWDWWEGRARFFCGFGGWWTWKKGEGKTSKREPHFGTRAPHTQPHVATLSPADRHCLPRPSRCINPTPNIRGRPETNHTFYRCRNQAENQSLALLAPRSQPAKLLALRERSNPQVSRRARRLRGARDVPARARARRGRRVSHPRRARAVARARSRQTPPLTRPPLTSPHPSPSLCTAPLSLPFSPSLPTMPHVLVTGGLGYIGE
jgi:hypothetical protein